MKRKVLCLASIALCLLAVFGMGNTTCKAARTVKVNTVKVTNIDYTNFYTMRVSGTLQIKTSVSPGNATNKSITWSSSDKTVARVNNKGFVTGVNGGFCQITGVTKDGSKKKVSFYVRVYPEKEFISAYEWSHDYGDDNCTINLFPTGEYDMYDRAAGEELESGTYTLDDVNKTLTLNKYNYKGNTKKVWHYTIVSRSKLLLSDGTTKVTYTRNYKNKSITCSSEGFLYWPNGAKEAIIVGYVGTDTTMDIPSTMNKRKVTSVNGMGVKTGITQVIIPDTVISIEGSFENWINLKSVMIPDGVAYLGQSEFENCTALETVHLPSSLTAVQKQIFKGCTSLKSVEIPEQVVSVDSEAFCNCTGLEALYFPKGIKEIEPDILKGCNQVVIYGYQGTCAETFAKENNMKFIES